MTKDKDIGLDAYFEAGRAAAPAPSADLVARIMADAQTQMAEAMAPATTKAPRLGLFAGMIEAIGGWPTLAGMATAGVVGVWVGFSQPAGLNMVAEQLLGVEDATYLVDLVPAFSADFEEG